MTGGACCVVTFASFTDDRTLDRPGFGEAFLADHGIDAVHVLSRDNDWYQYAEMPDAMACVRAVTQGYARVVTYGSSMGAYAALRLAGLAGAHAAVALSPQYSIDPAVVPWEFRWRHRGLAFRALWERTLALPTLDEAYVFYDPVDRDRKHIALFTADCPIRPVRVPGGHPVTGYLSQTGLLSQVMLDICRGEFDVVGLEAEAAARLRTSAQAVMVLCERVPFRHREQKLALLSEAVALAPENADLASRAGRILARCGRFEESLALHRRALDLEPGQPNLLLNYSYSLEGNHDLPAALAAIEAALAVAPDETLYVERTMQLRVQVARQRNWWRRVQKAWAPWTG